MRIFALIILLSIPASVRAEFTVTEILFIPWGEEPNELEIWEPGREYSEDNPSDTVGFLVPSGGPRKTFVDRDENVYFSSIDISYFKGFDTNGQVIVDYSAGKTEFHDEFFRGMFKGFYVDSLGRIYCNGNERAGAYVAVADRNNNLLEKLNPLGLESGVPTLISRWGSDDVLLFYSEGHGLYTYMNDQFSPGGTIGWRASDGIYYKAKRKDSYTTYIIRIYDPSSTARPSSQDTTLITYEPGNLILSGLLGVDDNMRFYVEFLDSSSTEWNVRVYDQGLKLLDEFRFLPRQENIYLWDTEKPFFRHDGNVYEFHCRDDGMHVFRWSKK